MRRRTLTAVAVILALSLPAYAQPTDPAKKKEDPAKKSEVKTEGKVIEVATSQPTDEPKDPKEVPKDVSGAVEKGKELVDLAKAGQWFSFSAGVIWLLIFVFKIMRKKIDAMKKIPKRVLWIIVPVLSVAAMLLAKLQTDLSWGAVWIVATSGPVMALANDFVKRGVLGKEPSTPVNGGAG